MPALPLCDCGGPVPGALWPMASNCDGSLPWVERCEDCRRFECDDDAALAVSKAIGGRVMFATIPLDEPCTDIDHTRLHPFVLPVAPEWSEAMRAVTGTAPGSSPAHSDAAHDAALTCEDGCAAHERQSTLNTTLDAVHDLLSGTEWSADTVQAIAAALVTAGYTIDPPAPRDVGDVAAVEHDWRGAYCTACGADEASSFADAPCPGFPGGE